jgi:hypothetical protein
LALRAPTSFDDIVHTTKTAIKKVQTFINSCLRGILKIHWSITIRNKDLWEITNQVPAEEDIRRRRWRWIGHALRNPTIEITRQALTWNPQGKRKTGRHKNSWIRDLEATPRRSTVLGELERFARDRGQWRAIVDAFLERSQEEPDPECKDKAILGLEKKGLEVLYLSITFPQNREIVKLY